MTGLLGVDRVIVPRRAALDVQDFLRRAGAFGCEGFAIWVGERDDEKTFRVHEAIIPDQKPIRTESGIMVVIGPNELHALNVWLHEQKLSVVAQIHSHPTDAYHSETDDHLAIATVVGSLSFVVPDFAKHPFSLASWAAYRLSERGTWTELASADVERLIALVD